MVMARVSGIAIDCPDATELAAFYGTLLGIEPVNEGIVISRNDDGEVELWFQQVENYVASTWPTQERGQQMHLDLATPDIDAAVRLAESIGATKAERQPADDNPDDAFVVMLDPAGHPFCFVPHREEWDGPVVKPEDGRPAIAFRMPYIDCPDHQALAAFYAHLLGGSPLHDEDPEYLALGTASGFVLGFQRVDGYRAPTWPTQERGQQAHLDLQVEDRPAMVARAIELGATKADEEPGISFTVMLDPVGHPFCLCDR